MPCESDVDAAEEFNSVLADIVDIVGKFYDDCFVIGGDFKVDFDNHKIHIQLNRRVCYDN